MVKVELPIPSPSISRKHKRHRLPAILAAGVVLILIAIGAYSVYHYAGAGLLFDQKHHSPPKLISQNLPTPPNLSVVRLSPSSSQSLPGSTATKPSSPSATTQPISLVASTTAATGTANPPPASCSDTDQQTITELQTELNGLTEQRSQLSESVTNLLASIETTTNQRLQQLQTQIDSLTSQIQTLDAAAVTC